MRKLIGDRAFYKTVIAIALPLMLQSAVTGLVGMLDNIMVGRLGTEQMTGVAVANELLFVYQLLFFGGLSGAGIFTAQFFGLGDEKGIRYSFRFKLIICIFIILIATPVLLIFDKPLIGLYLNSGAEGGDPALTLYYARQYLPIMLAGYIPFAFAQTYATTLREMRETRIPVAASLFAVLMNTVLNYILIFGKLGLPALGVRGAAIATVLSRAAEFIIVFAWTHSHKSIYPFIRSAYRSLRVPKELILKMIRTTLPLFFNEGVYSAATAAVAQCYSTRGIFALAGFNIANTLQQISFVVCFAMGHTINIMVGNLLGAGEREKARDSNRKLIAFCVFAGVIIGIALALIAPFFPRFFNTEQEVKRIAESLILINAAALPILSFDLCAYFTMRCGGRTFITFLFDGVFNVIVVLPAAFMLSRFTALDITALYAAVISADIIKFVIGVFMIRSGTWANTIVEKQE